MRTKVPARVFALVTLISFLSGLAPLVAAEAKDPLLPREKVRTFLEIEAIRRGNTRIKLEDMERTRGRTLQMYPLSDINFYLEEMTAEARAKSIEQEAESGGYAGPKTLPWVHLRRSHSDVLASEDPTLKIPGDRNFDDLEGALLSFSHDFIKDTDTWSSEAALIAPFSWATNQTLRDDTIINLARWGFVPSVSLNRVSTSGDASDEVDLQAYRLGAFAKFELGSNAPSEVTLRGFGSYTADRKNDVGVWAGEFEVEPQADFSKRLKVGYRAILITKPKAERENIHDTAILAYQARVLLRGEYGSVNNIGSNFAATEFNYFRLGPRLQLDLKPFFFRRLHLSLRYHFLPTISGKDSSEAMGIAQSDSLFNADAEWLIVDPEVTPNRRLSLKVSYVNGGVGPTQENTHTVLVGLGAAF